MKLLTAEQIRAWDAFTIKNEPITSYDLMGRASTVFTDWFSKNYNQHQPIIIFCGTGNNGGDGLAIARLLSLLRYEVHVFICRISKNETEGFAQNLKLLNQIDLSILRGDFVENDVFPSLPKNAIIIDAILGSGLSRPVEGYWAAFFEYLNQSALEIVSVDIPSGLFPEKHTEGTILKANRVLSFEIPKLAFLLPENQSFVKDFDFKSIGLHSGFLNLLTLLYEFRWCKIDQ